MILQGDCVVEMAKLPAESIDSVVCDPPYGLEFMGRAWDKLGGDGFRRRNNPADVGRDDPFGRASRTSPEYRAGREMQAWHQAWATEALRVLKPGGYLLAFGGTRTFHRLTCAVEDAGFEIRDCLSWMYGQGFPKSLNLHGDHKGWGTALKPAWEPIIMARKPLIGTVAANVQQFGTGAINVDACRVEGTPESPGATPHTAILTEAHGAMNRADYVAPTGRWPANVVLDEEAAALLDEQSGESKDGVAVQRNGGGAAIFRSPNQRGQAPDQGYGGTGGASRFFYCAKASPTERSTGLLEGARNTHPTVKPLRLMSWLVRMVTPPGGTVLDPFLGSGSTALAAVEAGFRWVGIERDPEYVAIAEQRLGLFGLTA